MQPAMTSFDAEEWPMLAAVLERSAAWESQHRLAADGADHGDGATAALASAMLTSSWPPEEGGAPPSLEATVRAVSIEAATLRATRPDDTGVPRAVEAADRAKASVGAAASGGGVGVGADAAEPGRDVAAAVLSLQGVDWAERIKTAMSKIDAQCAEFEEQLRHLREHGALPAEAREVAQEQLLDAVGALAATAQVLVLQAQSEGMQTGRLFDPTVDRLCAELRRLPLAVAAVRRWGFEVPRRLLNVGESELRSMPLAATDPIAVDGARGGATVQRVIGALAVAGGAATLKLVALVDFNAEGEPMIAKDSEVPPAPTFFDEEGEKRVFFPRGDSEWSQKPFTGPPREAIDTPECANLAIALRVYGERATVATATLVPRVLADVAAYADAKAEAMSHPEARAALNELDMLCGNVPQPPCSEPEGWTWQDGHWDPLKRAMVLVKESDADAPPPTALEHAVHKQQRAVAGSKRLYQLVSEMAQGIEGHELVVLPGGVKKLARTVFKCAVNYGCDLSRITDQVRCTVVASTLGGVAAAMRGLVGCGSVSVVRVKNRFASHYDAVPAGGYVDLQTMVVFESEGGGWVMGEVQINLWSMLRIKENPQGGHKIFNFARAMRAYDEATFQHGGGFDDSVAARIAAGVLLVVSITRTKRLGLWESVPAMVALQRAMSTRECRVRELNLSGIDLDDSRAVVVAEALKHNTSVSTLNLNNNKIGDLGAAALGNALKSNTSVSKLEMRRNCVGDSGAEVLADALKNNTSVSDLSLCDNNIGDKGAAALAVTLKSINSISSLDLQRNDIGDSGAAALADALKTNTSVYELNLILNKIGDPGAAALADALKHNTSVSTLFLNYNDIGDSGAAAMAAALKINTTVSKLNLYSMKITASWKLVLADIAQGGRVEL